MLRCNYEIAPEQARFASLGSTHITDISSSSSSSSSESESNNVATINVGDTASSASASVEAIQIAQRSTTASHPPLLDGTSNIAVTSTSPRWLSTPIDKLRGRLQRLGSYNYAKSSTNINDATDTSDATIFVKRSKDDNVIPRHSNDIQSWQSHVSLPDWINHNGKENVSVNGSDCYDYMCRQPQPLPPRINTRNLSESSHTDENRLFLSNTKLAYDPTCRRLVESSAIELIPATNITNVAATNDEEQDEFDLKLLPSPALSACPSLDIMEARPTGLQSSSSSIHSVLSLPPPVSNRSTASSSSSSSSSSYLPDTPVSPTCDFNTSQPSTTTTTTTCSSSSLTETTAQDLSYVYSDASTTLLDTTSTTVSTPSTTMVSVSSSTPSSSVKSSLAHHHHHHHHHHSNDGGNGNGSNGGTIDESAYLTEKLTPISSELSEPLMAPPMLRETSGSSTVSSSGDTMDVDDLIENDDSENDDDNNKVNAPFPTMRYKAIRQLGSGSFASVWLTCDKQQNYREVAIKVVNKKSDNPVDIGAVTANVERARREASLLQTIEHPNIVTIFDEFETDDVYCLVLEFANGGDLFDWVTKQHHETTRTGPEFERITRDIFGQLLDALLYLHAKGIIHRDIKLENVLLEHVPVTDSRPSGLRVLLADFGLAIAQTPRGEQPLMAGSDEYAAPEAILQSAMSASAPVVSPSSGNASGGYDRCKTDVWSLGVVLYALLYGRLPFLRKANQTRRSFLYRVAQGDVSFPSDVDTSKAASEIVRALLRRKPGDRLSLNEIKHMPWVQNYMLSLNSSAHHS